jgi:hypothetical protein
MSLIPEKGIQYLILPQVGFNEQQPDIWAGILTLPPIVQIQSGEELVTHMMPQKSLEALQEVREH